MIALEMPRTNRLTIVVVENEWRHERGPKRTFTCTRLIEGAAGPQTLSLGVDDFTAVEGTTGDLASWAELDLLGICGSYGPDATAARWDGPPPTVRLVTWEDEGGG